MINRRTFMALGASIAGAAAIGTRLGFPRYRVRLHAGDTYAMLGEWKVIAVERAPDAWYKAEWGDVKPMRHLWIDPLKGNGWDDSRCPECKSAYPGEACYHLGPNVDPDTRQPVGLWGTIPWGDRRDLVDKHGGLCVSYERIA